MHDAKARERRLREALAARGLVLVKDPRRREWQASDPLTGQPRHPAREPGYMVTDGAQVVAGEWYSLTLDQAERVSLTHGSNSPSSA